MMEKLSLKEQDQQAQAVEVKVKILPRTEPVLCSALTAEATVALHLPRPLG